ncbi:MAG: hypothetical protein U0694_11445 [Anaerolineae bacterium]
MPDKKSLTSESQTGAVRLVAEPRAERHDPPQPSTLPEMTDDGATTGVIRIVTEGKDRSAALDHDSGQEG